MTKAETPPGAPPSPNDSPVRRVGAEPTFEAAMQRLGEIVEQLESGELPLDESLRLFEEGVALSRRAGELLDHAERKVEALTRTAAGGLGTVPFEMEPEE